MDDRLLLVQNIRENVTEQDMEKFLSLFGNPLRITLRNSKNPKFKVKSCYVHYQVQSDSIEA